MLAFGTPEKQILIEPIFSQWIQSAHGKTSYGFDVILSSTTGPAFNAGRSIWLPGWLNAVNENSSSLFLTIGLGDFLVHHAIALGLHTTTLILVKETSKIISLGQFICENVCIAKNGRPLKSGQVILVQVYSKVIRSANPYLATPGATVHGHYGETLY
uniref:Uncharacterized protein n=1 Tax=Solanum lycopersicum TaxID=4081 RepID=K4BZF3_SOLLC